MASSDKEKIECETRKTVLKQDRHRSVAPYEWFGPSPEPCPPGEECACSGCEVRFIIERKKAAQEMRES